MFVMQDSISSWLYVSFRFALHHIIYLSSADSRWDAGSCVLLFSPSALVGVAFFVLKPTMSVALLNLRLDGDAIAERFTTA